jgi:membrane dipeptidase
VEAVGDLKKNRLFIDCHEDIAYSIRANKREFDTDEDRYMISLESLTNSKLNIIFSTIFVSHLEKKRHRKEAIAQIDEYEKIFKNYKNKFFKIQRKKDLKRNVHKKTGLIFLMEGAEPIKKIDDLDFFHKLGLRILSLTWNHENQYAFGSKINGILKKRGRQLIERMNEKNITLDLSHLSETSFWEALNITKLIPIASHSNSYFIRRHKRNLKDGQLRAISDKGGVTGIVLYNDFISSKKSVNLENIFNHFSHLLNICGEDHISLGSDIDGGPVEKFPVGIKKASDLIKIINLLESKKIKSSIIDKFAGKNILRVLNANLV